MTIKRTVAFSSILLLLATITLIVFLISADKGVAATRVIQSERNYALALADELEECSRGLTAAVQSFVVTCDERYASDYNDILMTMFGEKARPKDSAIAPERVISLNELISEAGYSDKEISLLKYAHELSDTLALYEIEAMNIARGLYADDEGKYTVAGEANPDLARSMIFNSVYDRKAAEILNTLDIFNYNLNIRLSGAITETRNRYDNAISIVWIVLVIVVVMFTAFLLLVYFMIVRPVLMCDMFAKQVTNGNLDSELNYESSNEIGSLASSLRSMMQYLLERMHLKEHARYFDAVISVADAGVVVMDKNHFITDWNLGAEHILGYKAEEITGKTRKHYAPDDEYVKIDEMETRLKNGENIMRTDSERKHKNGTNVICSASYTPVFDDDGQYKGSVSIFHDVTEVKTLELAVKNALADVEERNTTILSSIDYASKIQKNLLPKNDLFLTAFSDYSILWKPRDIVGGDIYLLKDLGDSSVLCVCDCTGHGIPGALLTMMVISTLENIINEDGGHDTANIIWQLDKKLAKAFNYNEEDSDIKDGCDLAVLFISKDRSVTISSGNMHVFVCDGEKVTNVKGQRLYIGEGKLNSKGDVNITTVEASSDNKFYVASDGLYDQIGGESRVPFGYKKFERIILENHNEKQAVISDLIWQSFESHRGAQERIDDFELITFKP